MGLSKTSATLTIAEEVADNDLESATDIAGIGAALEAGRGDIEALASSVESTLVCDN